MKLPFSICNTYSTHLSQEDIVEQLQKKHLKDGFEGVEFDTYSFVVKGNVFQVKPKSSEDVMDYFPSIRGKLLEANPTFLRITIRPKYFYIICLGTISFLMAFAGLFVDNWTINGAERLPTIGERCLIIILGSVLPGALYYRDFIRPLKRAEQWILQKLSLVPLSAVSAK